MVTSPNFRHPATLAKEAMTLDHVSHGRLTLGIGAGGPGPDATVLGGEQPSPGERVGRVEEFVDVVDRLLRELAVTHRGEWYTVDDARMIPGCVQQPRVPVAIAAGGARMLALAARHAEAWISYGDTSHRATSASATERIVREQLVQLEDACARRGRDPSDLDRIYLIGNSDERPLASVDAFGEFAQRYAALGFTDLVFHHPRPDDPVWNEPEAIVEDIARDVLPVLRR
jgi:alkanesulfonate monooxygenase SsuD/methylene tetrahydromethanopterin reductase-like flavin-dependent oxidoreductase (luciferase family)